MGNTNIPQVGAADTDNSRDTLTGEHQLTEERQKQRAAHKQGGIGPAPGRPENAPERIPGQARDPAEADDVEGGGDDQRRRDGDADADVERPGNTSDQEHVSEDAAALAGHANTGHSPADAT